jgi:hypothetical protein
MKIYVTFRLLSDPAIYKGLNIDDVTSCIVFFTNKIIAAFDFVLLLFKQKYKKHVCKILNHAEFKKKTYMKLERKKRK